MESTVGDRVALMLVEERRLALALAPMTDWRDLYGRRMLRLGFPSVVRASAVAASAQALALCESAFGCRATLLAADWVYGPSPRHAIDRRPVAGEADAPFLRYERFLPPDDASDHAPRPISIALYRAVPVGALAPAAEVAAGALWLPLEALQSLMRGASAEEAWGLADVEARLASGVTMPDDAFVYLSADVGERLLPRIAAKYGERALFAAPAPDA